MTFHYTVSTFKLGSFQAKGAITLAGNPYTLLKKSYTYHRFFSCPFPLKKRIEAYSENKVH